MFGIFYLIGYGMPAIVCGAGAVVGFFAVRYFLGYPPNEAKLQHWQANIRVSVGIWLAVSIPVVAAFTLVIPTFTELQKFYGPLLQSLWVWTLACTAIGGLFGWSSTRS